LEATDKAFRGYGTLDIAAWGDKLEFGTWVARPVDEKQVDALCANFAKNGIRGFTKEAQLPLIVPPSSIINVADLWQRLKDAARPPVVQFAKSTLAIAAAGGQHRMAAIAKYRTTQQAIVARLEERIAADADNTGLLLELQREQETLEETNWWGIEIYDDGMSLYTKNQRY
jgi:hypothetical protein